MRETPGVKRLYRHVPPRVCRHAAAAGEEEEEGGGHGASLLSCFALSPFLVTRASAAAVVVLKGERRSERGPANPLGKSIPTKQGAHAQP
jgi:hypothetical protein